MLRAKFVVVVAVVSILAALAAAIIVASRQFIARFDAIELAQMNDRASQVRRALEADLNQLALSTRDYAEWDDAQAYVINRDRKFLEANFSYDSLEGMQVDAVVILASDGAELYSATVDAGSRHLVKPAPAWLVGRLRDLRLQVAQLRRRSSLERILRTDAGLTAFAAVGICRSDKSAPTGATMFFTRWLRRDDIERVKRTSQLPVEFRDLARAPGKEAVPVRVRDWFKGSTDGVPTDALARDADTSVGYGLLADVDGKPVAFLTTTQSREVARLGRRTTWSLMGTLSLVLAGCALVLAVLMLRMRRDWMDLVQAQRQRLVAEFELREKDTRFAHLAEHDVLTGLPNRAYLHRRLPLLLEDCATRERSLALAYLDVDQFKVVNDARGHAFGDALLNVIARRLRDFSRAEDVILRLGGDEFVIIAPGIASSADIHSFGQRLRAAVSEPIVIADLTLRLTASVGVVLYPRDGLDAETLLKNADIALYQAKESGRDCFRSFSADMSVQLCERLMIEQALRRAIETEQIHVHYQPIVDLRTGAVVSFEALARWKHPELGSIPPGRFIPVAEASGLIIPLGEQIVREVIAQLARWRDAGLPLVPVAVNVAPIQFERTQLTTYVHEMALEYDVDPRWLAFEVTESAWMQHSNKHIVMIETLRHAGSRVYIDDFGTGFSNLSYLNKLPIDAVKIDQAFVSDITSDPGDAAIVAGVISMARTLNLDVVAEGIETAAQAAHLRAAGCRFGQGYFFSRPMPAEQCREFLERAA